jgi:hypothetical protein
MQEIARDRKEHESSKPFNARLFDPRNQGPGRAGELAKKGRGEKAQQIVPMDVRCS